MDVNVQDATLSNWLDEVKYRLEPSTYRVTQFGLEAMVETLPGFRLTQYYIEIIIGEAGGIQENFWQIYEV